MPSNSAASSKVEAESIAKPSIHSVAIHSPKAAITARNMNPVIGRLLPRIVPPRYARPHDNLSFEG